MKTNRASYLASLTVAICSAFLACQDQSQADTKVSVDQARALVAPFYDALNQPAKKDVAALLGQATSADWLACSGDDACVPRDVVIGGFKSRGDAVPDLKWEIKEVLVDDNRIIVRGEGSGTPTSAFLGIAPTGKSFHVMSIDVHTVDHGKIVRSYHLEDWSSAAQQLTAK